MIIKMFHKFTCYKASRMLLHSTSCEIKVVPHIWLEYSFHAWIVYLKRVRGTTNHLSLPEDKHPKTLWIPILVVPILGETLPMP